MIDIIIVPQGAEYKAVQKRLNKISQKPPLIVAIPIGTKNIATILNNNFWQYKPKRVLMMGLCGSLSPQYSVGDVVVYQNCCSEENKIITTNKKLNKQIIQKLNLQQNRYKASLVSGFTSDRIIFTVREKHELAKQFNTNVVDMESFSYLSMLKQKEIAVSILRIVSDDVKFNLPNLEKTIDESGKIKPLAMTTSMIKQPLASLKFIKGSLKALQKLQQVTKDIFI